VETALVVLSIFSVSFLLAYVNTIKKLKSISDGFASLFLEYNQLREHIETKGLPKSDEEIHNENFIKFLSDSRDWAFKYIEDVQNGLSSFIKEVEPQIEHYKKYGGAVEGMMPPHDFALKKISKEFEELKKLLPKELDDRR